MNEVDILRATNHPNVTRILDVYEDSKFMNIVLEYLDGKDLFTYLERKFADEKHICEIVAQLVEGMIFLHNQLGVMHRDIKMENILVNYEEVKDGGSVQKKSIAKIIDFGLALVLLPHEKCRHAFGTLAYCSPEIILNHPHTKMTDIWSFGIVMHVMLTLRLPFLAHHKRHTSKNIV
jgi:serine/threonine protein kinase